MDRGSIGPIGVFQIAVAVLAAIAFGVDFLIEGRVSKDIAVCIFGIYAVLTLVGFHEHSDNMRDKTEDLEKENKELRK